MLQEANRVRFLPCFSVHVPYLQPRVPEVDHVTCACTIAVQPRLGAQSSPMPSLTFATFALAVVNGAVPTTLVKCACHFGETTESDGLGGDCSKDHMCPEATPNCTGYVYDRKWGKCTVDGIDPDADYESESYANLGYNFDGYDTQGATASPPVRLVDR